MSRIGNRKLTLPTGVTASLEGNTLTIKGAKGSLSLDLHKLVSVEINDTEVVTKAKNECEIGDTVSITINRNGKNQTLTLTLGETP